MQALVRVQARVRARRVRIALESETAQQKLQQQLENQARVREIEVRNKQHFVRLQLHNIIYLYVHFKLFSFLSWPGSFLNSHSTFVLIIN